MIFQKGDEGSFFSAIRRMYNYEICCIESLIKNDPLAKLLWGHVIELERSSAQIVRFCNYVIISKSEDNEKYLEEKRILEARSEDLLIKEIKKPTSHYTFALAIINPNLSKKALNENGRVIIEDKRLLGLLAMAVRVDELDKELKKNLVHNSETFTKEEIIVHSNDTELVSDILNSNKDKKLSRLALQLHKLRR